MAGAAMTGWGFLASGFGIGFSPKAPGTFGSLLGLLFGTLLLSAGHLPLAFGSVVVAGVGTYAIGTLKQETQDPGWVVIDEIAGQMIPLLALSGVSIRGLLVSFALFRFFDIVKLGPVGWADKRHDEYGVMADDLIAGALAAAIILLLRLAVPL
jgi:phosphatidylglycerophosphatase A